MGSECSIADCGRPAVARTWCRPHWKHWRRWGDPAHYQTEKPRRPASDRFWSKVEEGEGCWEWMASRDPLGYGFFRMTAGQPMWRAHRASWALTNGPIPDGLIVCHHCDNPPCVRPDHLFLGTGQDNVDDRVAKDRSSRMITHFGETSPKAKLTAAQVELIRRRYAIGEANQRELGAEYGVSQTAVSKILRGLRWKQG